MGKKPLGKKYKQLSRKYDKLFKTRKINSKKVELYHNKLAEIEDIMVDRNLKGTELEKKGNIEDAVKLYEQNITDEFDGTHSYNRLAIIYRKKGQIEDEIRVLKKAIQIFETNEFKERLKKAKALKK